jgi:bacteriocin-like protein
MKNQTLNNGKKLNKKQLRSITGGKEICTDPSTKECFKFGIGCVEKKCQLI